MHHTMAVIALLAASACTETTEQVFDGQYRVTIVQTANSCDAGSFGDTSPGLTTRLDLFRRSDGLYDLHWIDGWVPDIFAFSAVDLGDGAVSQGLGGPAEVVGMASTESLDLELVQRASDVKGQPCERRATVRGNRRPMFASDAIDGRFIATVEHRGGVCADGTVIPAAGAWNMRMEVLPFRDDRTSVLIEGLQGNLLRFWIEPIGSGGAVHLTHDEFFAAGADSITLLDGTIEGTIEPDRVQLAAEIVAKDDPKMCTSSYAISGNRWMPSVGSLDAEYKTTYRMTDTCDPTYDVVSEDAAYAVGQADHRLDLIDKVIQSTVTVDGSNVTSNGAPTYRGTVTPDHTSYVIEDHYSISGNACVSTLQVDGTARYRTR